MTAQAFGKSIVVKGLLLAFLCEAASAQSVLPPVGPMPSLRPATRQAGVEMDPSRFGSAPAAVNPAAPRRATAPKDVDTGVSAFTASISSMSARPADVRAVSGELSGALKSVSSGDMRKARAIREGMPRGSLDRQILTWAIALKGGDGVPAHEIARASADLEGWPGMKTLRANSERALYREEPSASDIVNAFSGSRPETPEGAMALSRALMEVGQAGDAKRVIARVWQNEVLDRSLEQRILQQFGAILTKTDHKRRMDMLLYRERVADAGRMKTLANSERLYAAWAAAIKGESGAGKLLANVPSSQHSDPGYIFATVEHLRKRGKVAEAAAALLKAPRDAASLVNPEAWWNERRIVARDLLDLGRAKDAYRVAAAHSAENPPDAAEAEFHAGWIALTFLKDPRAAGQHFARIADPSGR